MTAPACSAPERPRVSIAERAGRVFPPHATVHGFSHLSRGEVELEEVDARSARARVRGKRTHEVLLREDAGRLLVSCTCPARALGILGCKHAWAALLEIDRRGALEGLRHGRSPLVVDALPPAEQPSPTKNASTRGDGKKKPKRPKATPPADGDAARGRRPSRPRKKRPRPG